MGRVQMGLLGIVELLGVECCWRSRATLTWMRLTTLVRVERGTPFRLNRAAKRASCGARNASADDRRTDMQQIIHHRR